ncbi:MAG: polysaccharide biosynthesis protein [Clostridia bacterium]|nr:polysaccharide biosynthesis protein [Clostridia bacterium]
MKKLYRSAVFYFADIITLNIGLFIAYFIRFDFNIQSISADFIRYIIPIALISSIFKVVIFSMFKLYHSLWRYAGAYEVVKVVIASAVANMSLSAVLILQYDFAGWTFAPRSLFALTFMLDVFAVGGVRLLYRIYRRMVTGAAIDYDNVRRVLIIGAGDAGTIIAREMKRHPELHQKPIAFIDNDSFKVGNKVNGIPIVGNDKKILSTVQKERINEIIIALPKAKPAVLNKIYEECSKTNCRIRILPSVSQIIDESVVMQKVKDISIEDLLGREMVKLNTEEIESFICGKTVLVTGAGGSIGSELCRQIAVFKPSKLVMLDNYENNLHDVVLELKVRFPLISIEPVIANIREALRMENVFNSYRPNLVFHAAAHKHVPLMEWHPEEAVKNNVIGTWNVAHSAHKAGVERFVLISSDKAVNPTNVMGATKRIAEMIIQALNTKSTTEFVAVRFGNVLGSNGSVIPIFKRQIEQGGPVTVTHPDMTRYFMAIPEAAQLVIQAGAIAKGGEIFVLDMGQPVKILTLAENMIRLSGFEPYEDIPIEFIGMRPGEKLYEELLLSEEGLEKTKNDKIYVGKPLFTDYQLIYNEIGSLNSSLLDKADPSEIRNYIKRLVPTYVENSPEQVAAATITPL